MNTKKFISKEKTLIIVNIILGTSLIMLGKMINLNLSFITNKAIVALSIIPFSIALTSIFNIYLAKKNPNSMKNIVNNEFDERLVLRKMTAEAKSFRVLKYLLYIAFLGFTFSNPDYIFKSIEWWVFCFLVFAPHFLTIIYEVAYDYNEFKE